MGHNRAESPDHNAESRWRIQPAIMTKPENSSFRRSKEWAQTRCRSGSTSNWMKDGAQVTSPTKRVNVLWRLQNNDTVSSPHRRNTFNPSDKMQRSVQKVRPERIGIAWTLVDQAIVSGGTFITTVMIARLIGVEQFGFYSLAVLFILLVQNLQAAAIVAPMMVVRSRLPRRRVGGYDRSVLEQSATFSGLSAFLGFMGVVVAQQATVVGFSAVPFSAAIATSAIQDFQRRYAFTRGDSVHAAICDSIRLTLLCGALTAFWAFHTPALNATYVLWTLTLTNVPSIIYSAFKIGMGPASGSMRRYVMHRHFKFSAWMTSQALLQYVTTNTQYFLIAGVLSTAAVGALRAAMNLSNLVNVLLLALENSLPVQMAHAAVKGVDGVVQIFRKTLLIQVIVFIPLLLLSATFGSILMRRIYGGDYESYGDLVFWWMSINFVSAIAIPLKSALRTFERPKRIFYAQVLSSSFVLLCTPMAIRILGILGGPIVLLAALVVFNCAAFYWYRSYVKANHDYSCVRNAGSV